MPAVIRQIQQADGRPCPISTSRLKTDKVRSNGIIREDNLTGVSRDLLQ